MKVTILGIDLAKNVFRLHGVDAEGRPVLRKQLRRAQLLPFMRQLTPCLVGLEACHSAHYWGRARVARASTRCATEQPSDEPTEQPPAPAGMFTSQLSL
jgi:transposase